MQALHFFQLKDCVLQPMKYITMLGNPVNNYNNNALWIVWHKTDRPFQPPSDNFKPTLK